MLFRSLKDNVDGDGVQYRHDLRLTTGQLGTRFSVTANVAPRAMSDMCAVAIAGDAVKARATHTASRVPPRPPTRCVLCCCMRSCGCGLIRCCVCNERSLG